MINGISTILLSHGMLVCTSGLIRSLESSQRYICIMSLIKHHQFSHCNKGIYVMWSWLSL